MNHIDSSIAIPATAFTEAIESIVQRPLTDSDADTTIEDQLLEAAPFTCIILNISSVNSQKNNNGTHI